MGELVRLFGQLTPVMYPSPSPVAKIIPVLPVRLMVLSQSYSGSSLPNGSRLRPTRAAREAARARLRGRLCWTGPGQSRTSGVAELLALKLNVERF